MAHRAASETLPQVAVRTTGCQDTSAVLGTLRTIIIANNYQRIEDSDVGVDNRSESSWFCLSDQQLL